MKTILTETIGLDTINLHKTDENIYIVELISLYKKQIEFTELDNAIHLYNATVAHARKNPLLNKEA